MIYTTIENTKFGMEPPLLWQIGFDSVVDDNENIINAVSPKTTQVIQCFEECVLIHYADNDDFLDAYREYREKCGDDAFFEYEDEFLSAGATVLLRAKDLPIICDAVGRKPNLCASLCTHTMFARGCDIVDACMNMHMFFEAKMHYYISYAIFYLSQY